jgi:hypothetical protein
MQKIRAEYGEKLENLWNRCDKALGETDARSWLSVRDVARKGLLIGLLRGLVDRGHTTISKIWSALSPETLASAVRTGN